MSRRRGLNVRPDHEGLSLVEVGSTRTGGQPRGGSEPASYGADSLQRVNHLTNATQHRQQQASGRPPQQQQGKLNTSGGTRIHQFGSAAPTRNFPSQPPQRQHGHQPQMQQRPQEPPSNLSGRLNGRDVLDTVVTAVCERDAPAAISILEAVIGGFVSSLQQLRASNTSRLPLQQERYLMVSVLCVAKKFPALFGDERLLRLLLQLLSLVSSQQPSLSVKAALKSSGGLMKGTAGSAANPARVDESHGQLRRGNHASSAPLLPSANTGNAGDVDDPSVLKTYALFASAVLFEALKDEAEWPPDLAKAFLDDTLHYRHWVDEPLASSVVKGIITAFTKPSDTPSSSGIPPTGATETTPTTATASASPATDTTASTTTSTSTAVDGGTPPPCRYSDTAVRRHLSMYAAELATRRISSLTSSEGIHAPAMRPLIDALTSLSTVDSIRVVAARHLEAWLHVPTLVRYAKKLLSSVVERCSEATANDLAVVRELIPLTVKPVHISYYLECVDLLVKEHPSLASEALKVFILQHMLAPQKMDYQRKQAEVAARIQAGKQPPANLLAMPQVIPVPAQKIFKLIHRAVRKHHSHYVKHEQQQEAEVRRQHHRQQPQSPPPQFPPRQRHSFEHEVSFIFQILAANNENSIFLCPMIRGITVFVAASSADEVRQYRVHLRRFQQQQQQAQQPPRAPHQLHQGPFSFIERLCGGLLFDRPEMYSHSPEARETWAMQLVEMARAVMVTGVPQTLVEAYDRGTILSDVPVNQIRKPSVASFALPPTNSASSTSSMPSSSGAHGGSGSIADSVSHGPSSDRESALVVNQCALLDLQCSVALTQKHAISWCHTALPKFVANPNAFTTAIRMLLFVTDDQQQQQQQHKGAEKLLSGDMPVLEDTLTRLLVMKLHGLPIFEKHTLDILENLVRRAVSLHTRFQSNEFRSAIAAHTADQTQMSQNMSQCEIITNPLCIQNEQIVDATFQLVFYNVPPDMELTPDQKAPIPLAVTPLFWQACLILVNMAALNPPTVGKRLWTAVPSCRLLIEMLLTNSREFPPVIDVSSARTRSPALSSSVDDFIRNARALRQREEEGIEATERGHILAMEKHISLAMHHAHLKHYQQHVAIIRQQHPNQEVPPPPHPPVITVESSRLLHQLMWFDLHSHARRPPSYLMDNLEHQASMHGLRQLFWRSRDPDFCVDTMKRQGPLASMSWMGVVIESEPDTLSALPAACLCELVLDWYTAGPVRSVSGEFVSQSEQSRGSQMAGVLCQLVRTLSSPSSNPIHTVRALHLLCQSLSSKKRQTRVAAKRTLHAIHYASSQGLASPGMLPVSGGLLDFILFSDETFRHPTSEEETASIREWLSFLKGLPFFQMACDVVMTGLKQALLTETDAPCVVAYAEFLWEDDEDDIVGLALELAALLTRRRLVSSLLLASPSFGLRFAKIVSSACKEAPLVTGPLESLLNSGGATHHESIVKAIDTMVAKVSDSTADVARGELTPRLCLLQLSSQSKWACLPLEMVEALLLAVPSLEPVQVESEDVRPLLASVFASTDAFVLLTPRAKEEVSLRASEALLVCNAGATFGASLSTASTNGFWKQHAEVLLTARAEVLVEVGAERIGLRGRCVALQQSGLTALCTFELLRSLDMCVPSDQGDVKTAIHADVLTPSLVKEDPFFYRKTIRSITLYLKVHRRQHMQLAERCRKRQREVADAVGVKFCTRLSHWLGSVPSQQFAAAMSMDIVGDSSVDPFAARLPSAYVVALSEPYVPSTSTSPALPPVLTMSSRYRATVKAEAGDDGGDELGLIDQLRSALEISRGAALRGERERDRAGSGHNVRCELAVMPRAASRVSQLLTSVVTQHSATMPTGTVVTDLLHTLSTSNDTASHDPLTLGIVLDTLTVLCPEGSSDADLSALDVRKPTRFWSEYFHAVFGRSQVHRPARAEGQSRNSLLLSSLLDRGTWNVLSFCSKWLLQYEDARPLPAHHPSHLVCASTALGFLSALVWHHRSWTGYVSELRGGAGVASNCGVPSRRHGNDVTNEQEGVEHGEENMAPAGISCRGATVDTTARHSNGLYPFTASTSCALVRLILCEMIASCEGVSSPPVVGYSRFWPDLLSQRMPLILHATSQHRNNWTATINWLLACCRPTGDQASVWWSLSARCVLHQLYLTHPSDVRYSLGSEFDPLLHSSSPSTDDGAHSLSTWLANGNRVCDHSSGADGLIHRLIKFLIDPYMCVTSFSICRTYAETHPMLMLKHVDSLAALLQGHSHLSPTEFLRNQYLWLYIHVMGIVHLLRPIVFTHSALPFLLSCVVGRVSSRCGDVSEHVQEFTQLVAVVIEFLWCLIVEAPPSVVRGVLSHRADIEEIAKTFPLVTKASFLVEMALHRMDPSRAASISSPTAPTLAMFSMRDTSRADSRTSRLPQVFTSEQTHAMRVVILSVVGGEVTHQLGALPRSVFESRGGSSSTALESAILQISDRSLTLPSALIPFGDVLPLLLRHHCERVRTAAYTLCLRLLQHGAAASPSGAHLLNDRRSTAAADTTDECSLAWRDSVLEGYLACFGDDVEQDARMTALHYAPTFFYHCQDRTKQLLASVFSMGPLAEDSLRRIFENCRVVQSADIDR